MYIYETSRLEWRRTGGCWIAAQDPEGSPSLPGRASSHPANGGDGTEGLRDDSLPGEQDDDH